MEPIFWLSYALLWATVAVLFAGVFLLYRHVGQGLLNSPAGRAAQGPRHLSVVRPVKLRTLSGASLTVESGLDRAILVVFTATSCVPCQRLRPALASFATTHLEDLQVVVVCRGIEREVRAFARELPSGICVVADSAWKLGQDWRIHTTPFAVMIDTDGIVRGRASPGRVEDLNWLLEQLPGYEPAPTVAFLGSSVTRISSGRTP